MKKSLRKQKLTKNKNKIGDNQRKVNTQASIQHILMEARKTRENSDENRNTWFAEVNREK